jgi:hypothetical protein
MDKCKPVTFTTKELNFLTSNNFIPALFNVIHEDDVLTEVIYSLAPAFCTRSRTALMKAAAQKRKREGGQLGGMPKGMPKGIPGDSDDDEGEGEASESQLEPKIKFKRYVACLMACASAAGFGYSLYKTYQSAFVQKCFKFLLDNTDAGNTFDKTMNVFNRIIEKCSTFTSSYEQHLTKQLMKSGVKHVDGFVKIPSVVTDTLDTSFMTCHEAHTALHELFTSIDATISNMKTRAVAISAGAGGTIFGIKWVSGANPLDTIKGSITKFVDYHEAILDILLEGVDFTTTSMLDICKAMLEKWNNMTPAKKEELCQTAEAAVRATPGSMKGPGASYPRRGGKKTNKRRKQSKRKPKRKPKKTEKRRRRSKK